LTVKLLLLLCLLWFAVCFDLQEASKVESQMKLIARPMYSNPPLHGALLVSKILHDGDLKQQWYQVRESTSIWFLSVLL
jgi:aspartate/tyrosine/aromatic aminotransferase